MVTRTISTVDYHTAGEPFRIVTGGAGPLVGRTILDKRRYAAAELDDIRKLLVHEPRGHADMYGCFVTDPEDDDADIGVVFFHNEGYSTACGHGTIALVTWAIESGTVHRAGGPHVTVVVDVPSGRLPTTARVENGKVTSVRFRNVPSFVLRDNVRVQVDGREISADVSFGGAFYASVDVASLGLTVEPRHLNRLIELGRKIKTSIEAATEVAHPLEPELRDVYGVIFYEHLAEKEGHVHQRNVTVFADGEVDRSPCGSGTSARLALLDAEGKLERGKNLLHGGIVGTEFVAQVVGDAEVAGRPAVITEVEGSAYLTGRHTFVLDPTDPIGTGFLLR
ncbi:MAG TPA: proline racemase family protein [Actinomycetota bacterium]|nr:proline racemase family protein [Actinomycetota bacterium]